MSTAHQLSGHWARGGWLLLWLSTSRAAPPAPTQPQIARRFLLEILHAEYAAAYHRLAPEVQTALRLPAFTAAAQPLWAQGQRRGPAIELYQLGARLGGPAGHSQWFCRFSFARDSAQRPPQLLLEVTFRDTTARQVLGFTMRQR